MIHNKRMVKVKRNYWDRVLGIGVLILFLGACATPTAKKLLTGTIEGGIYFPMSRGFSIEVPVFKSIEIRDGVEKDLEWVDFQVGCCNWVESGGYSLEWIAVHTPAKNFGGFVDQADQLIRSHIKRSIDPDTYFATIQQRVLAINGKQAKQVIGRIRKDSIDALYAATVVNYGERYALGILMSRIQSEKVVDYRRAVEWKRYVRFMQSFKKSKASVSYEMLEKSSLRFLAQQAGVSGFASIFSDVMISEMEVYPVPFTLRVEKQSLSRPIKN